ncbi:MAG: hypothetical protein ACXABY_22025 [Candidatus Thorarchaeota archaeon]
MTGQKKQNLRIFVGICNSQDQIPSRFVWSLMGMDWAGYSTTVYRSGHPWDVVRNNRIIHFFLESGADILAKMDIDQEFCPGYIKRLVPLVEKYKVVGPLLFDRLKRSDFMPLMFSDPDYLKLMDNHIPLGDQKGLVEIPYPHTNLLYAREVLEKIPPPWYEAYLSPDGLDRANHVDFHFLDKIHKAGYKIHIDLDTEVGHLTTQPVTREFHERWNRGS